MVKCLLCFYNKILGFDSWRVDLTSDTQQRHRCGTWRCNSSSKAAERPVSSQQPSLSPVAHPSFGHGVATPVVLSLPLPYFLFFYLSCGTYCPQRRVTVGGRVTRKLSRRFERTNSPAAAIRYSGAALVMRLETAHRGGDFG